jgi:hypothetical protein
MLRITVLEEASEIRFVIEGKLVGPWVEELRKCWETSEIIQNGALSLIWRALPRSICTGRPS